MSDLGLEYTELQAVEPSTYAFVFICQHGRLEIEASLLAASLHRFNRHGFEMIAAIPGPEENMGKIERNTVQLFEKLGVKMQKINNKIIEDGLSESLYTNKIYSLRVHTDAQKLVFLDSDRMCLKEFWGDARFAIPFTALPVSYPGAAPYVGRWKEIFRAADARLPPMRLRIEGQEGQCCYSPPYFNSGLVAIDTEMAAELSEKWEECFVEIDSSNVVERRPFTEQIALAVAVCKMGLTFSFLDKEFANKQWCHYFTPNRLRSNWKNNKLARSLLREHQEIKEIILTNKDRGNWEYLLKATDYMKDLLSLGSKKMFKKVARTVQ